MGFRKNARTRKGVGMEIYVDKIPKYCDDCLLQDKVNGGCVCFSKYAIKPFLSSCPLKSLTTHDNQIRADERKRVVAEIRQELMENKDCYYTIRQCNSPHYQGDYVWCNETKLNKFLDQIERGGRR